MNTIPKYRARLFLSVLFCFAVLFSFAVLPAMAEDNNMYIAAGGYDYIALESRIVHSPSLGAVVIGDRFFISGIYQFSSFSDNPATGYPGYFHSIDLMLETHKKKHQILSAFKSDSDRPISGGWATMQATVLYNYQIISSEKFKLRLGLGASLGDFGIEMKNGKNWPLIPVPFLGIEYDSRMIEADLSFVAGPNLSITVFPRSKIRLSGEAELNNYRDLQDLMFTAALHYRFFGGSGSADDFAGISGGIKNSSFGFSPGDSRDPYECQYYALFTELDLTLLTITGGYAFSGRERAGQGSPVDIGNGYFVSLRALYQF